MTLDIKIFVSHRIDLEAETVKNPLFVPVRCGAVYDKRKNINMIGDDTGDNISEKRMSFNEMTVQYWAWKNVKADYYGLCHYRRYLSFAEKNFPVDKWGMVLGGQNPNLNTANWGISSKEKMTKLIEQYDLITWEGIEVAKLPTPFGYANTIYDHWAHYDVIRLEKSVLQRLLELVEELHPEFLESANEYLNGSWHYGSNCFIMRKELFYQMCQFQFDILFEIEKSINTTLYSETMKRTPAFLSEILFAIFLYDLKKKGTYNIKWTQLVFYDVMKNKVNTKEFFKSTVEKGIKALPGVQRAIQRYRELDNKLNTIQRNIDHLARVKGNVYDACWANEIHAIHKETFGPYKNINQGKDVVILGTGPSAAFYEAKEDSVHIGVNGALHNKSVNFDYYFVQDYRVFQNLSGKGPSSELELLKELNCVKFMGMYLREAPFSAIPEYIAESVNAKRYVSKDYLASREPIPDNLEFFPLMDLKSIIFHAIHFALYTNPKRMYLVGCDSSLKNGEHFYGGAGAGMVKVNEILRGYNAVKRYAYIYHPTTKIISINPVGLKGMFEDIYTEGFIKTISES